MARATPNAAAMLVASPHPCPPPEGERGRTGMTLIEILIAVGILALGMMGICALLPLGIRNTASSVNQTVAASVGSTAIISLQKNVIDLSRIDNSLGTQLLGIITGQTLDGSKTLVSLIKQYSDAHSPPGIDCGYGFLIPNYLDNATDFGNGKVVVFRKWDAAKSVWVNTDYSWSAALVPPEGEPVSDTTTYTAQVAIWYQYDLLYSGASVTLHYNPHSTIVNVQSAPADFWTRVKAGDYVRGNKHGIWYAIAELKPANNELVIATEWPYNYGATVSAEVASRFRLIAIYDTTIRP
jgi:prepilin-type N-terminal cleavage/methylation domain-containing protein